MAPPRKRHKFSRKGLLVGDTDGVRGSQHKSRVICTYRPIDDEILIDRLSLRFLPIRR